MRAILAKARFDLRTRLRSLVALALILGVGGGIVLTALAGASRIDTAYMRFQQRYPSPDINLLLGPADAQLTRNDVAALPGVRKVSFAKFANGQIGAHPARMDAPSDMAWFGNEKILAGRLPAPDRTDEVVVTDLAVRILGFRPGTEFRWMPLPGFFGGVALPTGLTFRVVGVVAATGTFGEALGSYPAFLGTPALERMLPATSRMSSRMQVFLEKGRAGREEFRAALARAVKGRPVTERSIDEALQQTQRSFHFRATTLRLLGLLAGLAVVLVISQTLSRQATLLSGDSSTLSALGMTRRQLRSSVGLVLGGVGAAGGILAMVVAFVASPFAPLGDARKAEVVGGLAFDGAVFGLGALAIAGGTILLSLPAAMRATRTTGRSDGSPVERRASKAVDLFQRLGMSAPAVAGARLAFDRRARTPTPARSTIAEIALGVAGLAAVLTLSGTVRHFIGTPALLGKFWDTQLYIGPNNADARPYQRQILAQRGVTGLAFGNSGGQFLVNGMRVGSEQISRPVFGTIGLPILEGRGPSAVDEVALGTETMRRLRVRIGDRVTVGRVEDRTALMTVVGRAVFSPYSPNLGLGHGILLTYDGATTLDRRPPAAHAFIQLDSRITSPSMFHAAFRRAVPETSTHAGFFLNPSESVNLGNVESLSLALAIVLAIFGLATLLHALVSVIRARSRDLAILKALGFDRRQVARTVAWQASFIAYIGLAIGVPLGIIAGRALWLGITDSIGLVPEVHLPALPLVAIIPVTLIAARLIAAIPGRAAARTSPALVLRAE